MYYLTSDTLNKTIYATQEFNKEMALKVIVNHLQEPAHKFDTLIWYKTSNDADYVGDDILGFYENNPNTNEPSKVILKGVKQFYRSLI